MVLKLKRTFRLEFECLIERIAASRIPIIARDSLFFFFQISKAWYTESNSNAENSRFGGSKEFRCPRNKASGSIDKRVSNFIYGFSFENISIYSTTDTGTLLHNARTFVQFRLLNFNIYLALSFVVAHPLGLHEFCSVFCSTNSFRSPCQFACGFTLTNKFRMFFQLLQIPFLTNLFAIFLFRPLPQYTSCWINCNRFCCQCGCSYSRSTILWLHLALHQSRKSIEIFEEIIILQVLHG